MKRATALTSLLTATLLMAIAPPSRAQPSNLQLRRVRQVVKGNVTTTTTSTRQGAARSRSLVVESPHLALRAWWRGPSVSPEVVNMQRTLPDGTRVSVSQQVPADPRVVTAERGSLRIVHVHGRIETSGVRPGNAEDAAWVNEHRPTVERLVASSGEAIAAEPSGAEGRATTEVTVDRQRLGADGEIRSLNRTKLDAAGKSTRTTVRQEAGFESSLRSVEGRQLVHVRTLDYEVRQTGDGTKTVTMGRGLRAVVGTAAPDGTITFKTGPHREYLTGEREALEQRAVRILTAPTQKLTRGMID